MNNSDNNNIDSFIWSTTYERYERNIKKDREDKRLGQWNLHEDKIKNLKYSYVYLKDSGNLIVKKYKIEKFEKSGFDKDFNDPKKWCFIFRERAAINAPIQGTAADVMRLAMMDIFQYINKENLTNLKMILQIHDELIFEVLDKDSQTVSKFIKKIMSDVSSNEFYNFSVPLTVDINIGKNWEEAH